MDGVPRKKLEFGVAAAIIGILALVLLQALEGMQREIEESAVQAEISALRVEILDRLAHREAFGGTLPAGNNPVVWAGRQPPGYAGERAVMPEATGVWYYDTKDELLVYRGRHAGDFRFRLTREGGRQGAPAVLAGVGLLRIDNGRNVK